MHWVQLHAPEKKVKMHKETTKGTWSTRQQLKDSTRETRVESLLLP